MLPHGLHGHGLLHINVDQDTQYRTGDAPAPPPLPDAARTSSVHAPHPTVPVGTLPAAATPRDGLTLPQTEAPSPEPIPAAARLARFSPAPGSPCTSTCRPCLRLLVNRPRPTVHVHPSSTTSASAPRHAAPHTPNSRLRSKPFCRKALYRWKGCQPVPRSTQPVCPRTSASQQLIHPAPPRGQPRRPTPCRPSTKRASSARYCGGCKDGRSSAANGRPLSNQEGYDHGRLVTDVSSTSGVHPSISTTTLRE